MKKVYGFSFILLLIFVCINLLFASKENSNERGVQANSKRENFTYLISNGKRTEKVLALVKYMVSIRSRRPQKYFGDNHFCAGTIIGLRKILTAAHCVMDKRKVTTRPRRLMVIAGTPNRLHIGNETQQLSVEAVIPHQNFIIHNTDDIAIIMLETELIEYPKFVEIMPLPNAAPDINSNCTAVGWGRLYYKGPLAANAAHIDVFILPISECQQYQPEYNFKGLMCAGDHQNLNADPCRGDSGGPLICNGVLTGVISWTIGCGNKNVPSLYTDVYYHLDWIMNNEVGRLSNSAYLTMIVVLMNIIYCIFWRIKY